MRSKTTKTLLQLAQRCNEHRGRRISPLLQVAAISVAAPASRAALSTYDSASGHVTVTSQHDIYYYIETIKCHHKRHLAQTTSKLQKSPSCLIT